MTTEPEMVPVQSSNIESVGYDQAGRTMHVKFKGSGTYVFEDVSPEAHASLVGADSIGRHFHANVKGKFKHRGGGQ